MSYPKIVHVGFIDTTTLHQRGDCPNIRFHTPEPDGYPAWFEWAADMSKTHRQTRCKSCGLFKIWVPKKVPVAPSVAPSQMEVTQEVAE